MEKRISMLPHKPHATSQPSRFSHTPRLSTDSAHNQHSHEQRPIHTSHHDISTGILISRLLSLLHKMKSCVVRPAVWSAPRPHC